MARKIRPEPPRVHFPVRTFGGDLLPCNLIEGMDIVAAHSAGMFRDTDVGKDVFDFALDHR